MVEKSVNFKSITYTTDKTKQKQNNNNNNNNNNKKGVEGYLPPKCARILYYPSLPNTLTGIQHTTTE